MSLDRYTNVLSFRRGGTTYTYHGYTTTEGGTKYLAVRKGGSTRYLPFTTSGSEPLKMRWNDTTYTLVRPSSKLVVSYTVTATRVFSALYRFNVSNISVTSNYGFTDNIDIGISLSSERGSGSTAMFLGAGSKSVTGASITGNILGVSWTLTVSVGSGGQGEARTDSGRDAKSNAMTWTYT